MPVKGLQARHVNPERDLAVPNLRDLGTIGLRELDVVALDQRSSVDK